LNILTIFTGIIWLIGIILLLVLKQDTMSSKEVVLIKNNLNFQLSFLLYFLISGILTVILIWLLWLIVFWIAYIVWMIIWTIKYFSKEDYKYFWTIQFIK
jgi:uncharacterized Tic20 family protein